MTKTASASPRDEGAAADNDELLLMSLPWDVVGSFLGLRDVLSLRLSSSHVAASLHDSLGYRRCSTWLGDELVRRNVYAFHDARHWRSARKQDKEEEVEDAPLGHDREEKDDDDDDEPCLLRWLVREGRPTRTTPSTSSCAVPPPQQQQQVSLPSPFDLLLRCLRVVRYLPQQVTVAYSGKYGKHCWGLTEGNHEADPGIVLYPGCHRRGGGCPTCRTPIETVPMATSSDRPDREGSPEINVHMTLCIPVGINPTRCVRLDRYHNKCLPNVPSDLVCPICRVTDRRTLVLTELSYQTEPGTERIARNHRSFTFTPVHEDDVEGDDEPEESPLPRKRRRRGGAKGGAAGAHAGTGKPYPPTYRESFLHQYYEERVAMDVKHAISLHCDHCRRFGVLSPAHLRPLHELGQSLQARVDPASRHVYFSSAFLRRAPPHR